MPRSFGTAGSAIVLGGVLMASVASAKPPPIDPPHAGALLRAIERLQVVGSVLYVAAHPDDENTRLLAYLAGQRGLRVGYLSMTRGGGGQNLVGAEQAELLGVVRTGELMAARAIDGAEQRFSSARDFGYSKSASETLGKWGEAQALEDVVRHWRDFRPDVVITRFTTKPPNHGHHTASAILAERAFEAAARPGGSGQPWQADRLIHNQSHWRMKPDTDKSGFLKLDVGTYDPRIGRAYGEVAAASRSMHKSQGFGSAPKPGPIMEYFTPLAGTPLTPDQDILAGLDTSWRRFPGTEALVAALEAAAAGFDPRTPHTALPLLAQAGALLDKAGPDHWRTIKQAELAEIMAACAGLYLSARAEAPAIHPDQPLEAQLTAILRAPADKVRLLRARVVGGGWVKGTGFMDQGNPWSLTARLRPDPDRPLSQPPWLVQAPSTNRYAQQGDGVLVADEPARFHAEFVVEIAGRTLTLRRPVVFARTDAVRGEVVQPVELLPPVTLDFSQRLALLPHGRPTPLEMVLRATTADGAEGSLRLTAPSGFTVTPTTVDFALTEARPEQRVVLTVTAAEGAERGALKAQVTVGGRTWALHRDVIDHAHLRKRSVLRAAEVGLVPLALAEPQGKIAYLQGSGDAVADVLRSVGYAVDEITVDQVAAGELGAYRAVLLGVRAYNKHPRLLALHPQLMAYVKGGGRLVAQYNTNNHFNPLDGPLGPYPFKIGRDRITDEGATLTRVDPTHPVWTAPNRLTDADFAGWVQERGLYFAKSWDPRYQTLVRGADAGGEPLEGSTLIARHGEGVFVYTGLSFFRQLPAGVPGALRLLANLLAL